MTAPTLKYVLATHLPHLLFIPTTFVSQRSPSQHFLHQGPHELRESQTLRLQPHLLNQTAFEQDPPQGIHVEFIVWGAVFYFLPYVSKARF